MEKILKSSGSDAESGMPKTAADYRALLTRYEKPGENGVLNARERLTALFDEGTFTEIGAYSVHRRDAAADPMDTPEGIITGYGSVDGYLVYAFAEDRQRTKGAVSDAAADKTERLYRLAVENGAPVVGCFDSAGADLVSGVRALAAYGRIMKTVSAASGVIPQIAIVAGPAQGASAVIASMFDFMIVTENATLSVAPAFVTGGGKAQDSVIDGAASLTAKDDAEATDTARRLLGLLPSNNDEGTVELSVSEDDPDRETDLSEYKNSKSARALLSEIADANRYFEIGAGAAAAVTTGFLSLDGTVIGTVATDRSIDGGKLSALGARKAARFISFCDSFSIPVLTVVDSEGYRISGEEEKTPYCAEIGKLAGVYAGAKSPLVTLVAGAAYGSVFSVLGSKSIGADLVLALDSARIGCLSPASAVALLENNRVSGTVTREQLEKEWEDTKMNVLQAARTGEVDDIIEEAELRQRLTSAILMLSGKASAAPRRRHANMPL